MNQNPYAPPSGQAYGPPAYSDFAQAELRGDVLVVRKNAHLPDVCLKCGTQQGIVRRTAKFSWTPTWARLSIVLCTLLGAIAIAVTTKRAQLSVPLCGPCNQRWSSAVAALFGGIAAIVLGVLAFRLSDEPAVAAVLFFVAIAAFIGLMLGFVKPRMLQVQKIDDQTIELKGWSPSAARVITGG